MSNEDFAYQKMEPKELAACAAPIAATLAGLWFPKSGKIDPATIAAIGVLSVSIAGAVVEAAAQIGAKHV